MKFKVSIIGSGKTGSTLALILALRGVVDEVWLFDSQRNFAKARAMDLEQSLPLLDSSTSVCFGETYKDLSGSHIVVITEGQPKSDTVHREDLLVPNARSVKRIARHIKKYAGDSIVIVLSNPYDAMTGLVLKETGFSRRRVFGSAGMLYASRFRTFLGKELKKKPASVETLFVGGGSPRFTPLLGQTHMNGKPITQILATEKIQKIVDHTRDGANEIIRLLGDGAAYIAPAAAASVAIQHICSSSKTPITVAVEARGEYGVTGVLNLPVLLGKKGVRKIVQLPVSEEERELLSKASDHYWDLVRPNGLTRG